MNHLLLGRNLLNKSNLPWRWSFLRFPKTVTGPDPVHDSLKRRIERVPDSMASVTPLLREWCQLGNKPRLSELRSIISSLHKFDRFSHALQISEWMSEQQAYNLSTVDFEIRLLLVAKIRGLEEASNFLDTIPLNKRDFYVHNALLNSCKTHGSISIAETTFQKMRDLGLAAKNPKPYNTMLSLYYNAQDHDMVVKLLREMDAHNVEPQEVPFGKLLSSFAIATSVKDLEGMDNFLNKWGDRMEPWARCFFPACLHLRLGSTEKALSLFRMAEELVDNVARQTIYGCLMTTYCSEGKREDVYRLFNLAKHHGISLDSSKCSEILELFAVKNDLDGAHDIMQDWDTGAGDLGLSDFGFLKRLIKKEADKAVDMLGKKENKWESLTDKLQQSLLEDDEDGEEERRNRVTEALKGMLADRWNPKGRMTLSAYACAQYVEGRRDMESAAEILRLLSQQQLVSRAMDKDRLSLKMVEAMRGGGYVGGQD